MDIKDIQNLIKFVSKSGVQEVKLEMEDFKITIKTESEQTKTMSSGMIQQFQPVQAASPVVLDTAISEVVPQGEQEDENITIIKSPIIGTFYRKAAAEKPPFVKVGDVIKEGDVLCVIEAMKLFNEIESEVNGTIVKILEDDASPVEFDQPLFVINPS